MSIESIKLIVDYGVLGVLGLMSFVSLWLYIERLLFFKSVVPAQYTYKEKLEIDLTNNISTIASFGSNAVYVGLLGTVFAIILTFYTMGQTGDIDVKEIMTSLSLALKATAAGLLVAIPAMLFYNHLARIIEVKLSIWEMEQKIAAQKI